MGLPEWIKIFNVSQSELRLRLATNSVKINKSRLSLLYNNKAQFTDWQLIKLKTVEKEVLRDRKNAFTLYKKYVINNNLRKNK